MLELQAGVEFGGAVKRFYDHHRTPVLTVLLCAAGLATGSACAAAIMQGISWAGTAVMAASAVLATGICLLQTRHPILAAVTALAPLPGLMWAAPLSVGAAFGPVPLLAYGLGVAVAALITESFIVRVLQQASIRRPWRAAAAAVLFSAVMAIWWFGGTPAGGAALQAVADSGLAVLSALALLPLALDLIHLDETFVAEANRVREWRQRLWERMADITIPRWALSFTGITAVMLALGWYGAAPVLRSGALLRVEVVVVSLVAAAFFARGWREGLAAGLVWATICLLALWGTAIGVRAPYAAVGVLQIVTLAVFLSLCGVQRVLDLVRTGEPPAVAQRRALEQSDGQSFAGGSALAAILPAVSLWSGSWSLAAGTIVAIGVGILLVPAASVALEVLIPRRRSVEELYGKKRRQRR